MGFRDDDEAARARADALERENSDLQKKIAVLQSTKETSRLVATRSRLSKHGIFAAGLAVILVAGIVIFFAEEPVMSSRMLLLVIGIASLGLLIIAFGFVRGLILVAGPNELLILSGRKSRLPDGRVVGYRVIRGGRVVRIPLFEQAERLSLVSLEISVQVMGAFTREGRQINVMADATVKLSSDADTVHNAIERFLGGSREDIARVARGTLEGGMRGGIADLTVKEMNQDRASAEQRIIQEVDEDFSRLGIILDTFHIDTIGAKE